MSTTPVPSILDPSHPLAYLAYLPPSLAYELTIAVYILVAAAVVMIWDVLNNLKEDYEILVKRPITVPSVVYCISRLSTLAYVIYALTYETAPIGNCAHFAKIPPWLYCVSVPSTSLLFYFRVTAIYNNNKYIAGFFFVMWLGVLGGCIASVVGVGGYNIGPTRHCISGTLKPFVPVAGLIPLANDSLIVIAISLQLMQIARPEETNMKRILKSIITRRDLPTFTRSLLRDGQVYYLTTTFFVLMTLITFYIDSIPLIYRTIFAIPLLTINNVMACRVYRRTKSGKYRGDSHSTLPLSFLRDSHMANGNLDDRAESFDNQAQMVTQKSETEGCAGPSFSSSLPSSLTLTVES